MGLQKKKSYEQEYLEWQWEQLRLRRKYKNTPAGFKNKEAERMAVRQWREAVDRFRKSSRHWLTSSEIFSREPFAGREEELALLKSVLEEGKGPVILYGLGGMGKSALAREYIRRYGKPYAHILYLSFRTTIQNMIEDDFDVRISNVQFNREMYENKRKYFRLKCEVLREIVSKEKTLIVVDNCNVEYDRDMERLFSLPCQMVVTTRRAPSAWGDYAGIQVGPLKTEEEWEEFVRCYTTGKISESRKREFDDYRKKVDGHTLLLQHKLINPDEDFSGLEDFQKDLFRRIPLKSEEKKAITYLSIMPPQGISKKLFLTITDVKEETLERLKSCMLAQQAYSGSWKDEMIVLHPIIAAAARNIFRPSAENCRVMIRGLGNYLFGDESGQGGIWDNTYLENQKMEPYIFAFMEAFPKPAAWLAEAFDEMVRLLWAQGYYKEAERYSMALYESAKEYYGEYHQITGQMAMTLAAIYHNSEFYKSAEMWYKKSVDILEKSSPFNQMYHMWLSLGYHKAAGLMWHNGDMEEAKAAIDKALKTNARFQETIRDGQERLAAKSRRDQAYMLLEKGRILLADRELGEAEKICLQLFQTYGDTEVMAKFRINQFMDFYIKILLEKKDYEKAEICAKDNMERALLYRGEEWKDTIVSRKCLADILILEGKMDEAKLLYDEIMGAEDEDE